MRCSAADEILLEFYSITMVVEERKKQHETEIERYSFTCLNLFLKKISSNNVSILCLSKKKNSASILQSAVKFYFFTPSRI